jgi:hypothetical protein
MKTIGVLIAGLRVQVDRVVLQSDLAAAEQRCAEAERESQASLEDEHATSDEVQLLRRQLLEARYTSDHLELGTRAVRGSTSCFICETG